MRILIANAPRMYRESLALNLHQSRPGFEVLLGPVESLDGQAESFRPHVLVRNDTDRIDMELVEDVLCRVEILYSDTMDARVNLDGEAWEIKDISTEDLLEIVNRTEKLMPEGTTSG